MNDDALAQQMALAAGSEHRLLCLSCAPVTSVPALVARHRERHASNAENTVSPEQTALQVRLMLVLAPAACCLAGAGLDALLSLCLASLRAPQGADGGAVNGGTSAGSVQPPKTGAQAALEERARGKRAGKPQKPVKVRQPGDIGALMYGLHSGVHDAADR